MHKQKFISIILTLTLLVSLMTPASINAEAGIDEEYVLNYISSNSTETSIEITLELVGPNEPVEGLYYSVSDGENITEVAYEGPTQTFTFVDLYSDTLMDSTLIS